MRQSSYINCFLSLPALALLLLSNATSAEPAKEVINTELNQQIQSGRPPVILDTRSSFEYKRGHLPGAQHFPFWLSYMRADDLDLPKDQPIVVYCARGPRAVFSKKALVKNGFSQVRLLKDHMTGWKKAGLPVE